MNNQPSQQKLKDTEDNVRLKEHESAKITLHTSNGPDTTEEPADPLKGKSQLNSTYEVVALIGIGGTSTIYKVRHTGLDKFYAAKVLHPNVVADKKSLKRFEREAKSVAELSHPNLVQVHDFGKTADGIVFLIMDYLEGKTLESEISTTGPLSEARVIRIFKDVCDGLQHAHKLGIVHRDLKPSNIMLVRTIEGVETPKILDFGIAQRRLVDTKITHTGEVFGTPLYMSPEQCMGTDAVDARTDIYALGCTMYEALSGIAPFAADTPMLTLLKQINDKPEALTTASHGNASGPMESIVGNCLSKSPADRPRTAAGLRTMLKAAEAVTASQHRLKRTEDRGANEKGVDKKKVKAHNQKNFGQLDSEGRERAKRRANGLMETAPDSRQLLNELFCNNLSITARKTADAKILDATTCPVQFQSTLAWTIFFIAIAALSALIISFAMS